MSFLERYFEIKRELTISMNNINITDTWEKQKIEYRNFLVGNPITIGGGMDIMGNPTEWMAAVETMGKWYQDNIHTYQGGPDNKHIVGRKAYSCPLVGGKTVHDDCSGFVTACVLYFGKGLDKWYGNAPTTSTMQPGSEWDRTLQANGFRYIPFSSALLKAGDIYCGHAATHVEICAGFGRQYGWGNTHDGINNHSGMPLGTSTKYLIKGVPYSHIWRYVG